MRRARTLLLGSLMVAGLIIGPGAGIASAQPVSGSTSQTFWVCTPHGSGGGTPTTTISSALLFDNPSQDAISCFFPNINQISSAQTGQHTEFGGSCYFNAGAGIGVQFRHRIYLVLGNTASLACWDGFFECMDSVTTTVLCSTTVKATIRRTRT